MHVRYFTVPTLCGRAPGLKQRLNGAGDAPWFVDVVAPVRREGRNYEATVALDHFEPGECGWHPFTIGFHVTNADGVSTGQFAADRDGGFEPGPEVRIWVDSRIRRAASPQARNEPRGRPDVRPLQLGCHVNEMRRAKVLSCVPDTPREMALVSEEATAVRVDFEDRGRR